MIQDAEESPSKWFDKAATQILFANTLVDDASLKCSLQKLCLDRPECAALANKPLNDLFRRLNVKLRNYGMEIKSVTVKKSGILYYYHGIANTEVRIFIKNLITIIYLTCP